MTLFMGNICFITIINNMETVVIPALNEISLADIIIINNIEAVIDFSLGIMLEDSV